MKAIISNHNSRTTFTVNSIANLVAKTCVKGEGEYWREITKQALAKLPIGGKYIDPLFKFIKVGENEFEQL